MNWNYEEINTYVKEHLSEKRYNHSLGVSKRAVQLANIYGENEEKARLTGLMHDIAKEISEEEKRKFIQEHNIKIDEIENFQIGLTHGLIGSYIAKEMFNFDFQMCEAIRNHTTGKINMDNFSKIIFLADVTEENRDYPDFEIAKNLSEKSLDDAVIYVLDMIIESTIKNKKLIHPNTIYLRNQLLSLKF